MPGQGHAEPWGQPARGLSHTIFFSRQTWVEAKYGLMTGGMGFVQPRDKRQDRLDVKVERTAQEAAKKKFSPGNL